jgi:diguanylate cyclase
MTRDRGEADAPSDAPSAAELAVLRDVNEQLVLTGLKAQVSAEAASRRHDDAARAAERDELTGLPNRGAMLERFAQATIAARNHGSRLAMLFVDLDHFKHVNDSLGHAAGDDVLRGVANALVAAVRDGDTVSRHGGDEFVVLLADIGEPGDVSVITEKLIKAIGAPTVHGDSVVRLTSSIGVSMFPDHGDDAVALIALADAAMYRAKRLRSGGFAIHRDETEGVASLPGRSPVLRVDVAAAEEEQRTAQLREANERLILAALSAQAMQTHAEEARKRQSEFMVILAHELRNPLTPIRNVSALLSGGNHDATSLARLQAIIERQVSHMSRLVDDLLDVTRLSTGKLLLKFERVELAAVVAEAIAACRPAMDVRMQHFTALIPVEPLWLTADRVRLTQVITNLLDNACKYTPRGGAIALSVTVSESDVVLTVEDTGIGIAAEELPRIFELFAQDPNGASQSAGGLGIGLTVVRELVTAHGGTIVARNATRGTGSEFVVRLPRTTSPVP